MTTISVFEREEYEKLIETLRLNDNDNNSSDDYEEYFNAWNFGKTEEDFDFVVSSSCSN